MQSRIKNPAMLIPDAMQALQGLGKLLEKGGVPEKTLALMHLRASQINGCSVCVDLDRMNAKRTGETEERRTAVAAWRDAPYFTDAERAALALTESVTRLNDRTDPVPDAVWDEAARHYDDRAMATMVLAIAMTNMWNRLNVSTRQIAGEWLKSADAKQWAEKEFAKAS